MVRIAAPLIAEDWMVTIVSCSCVRKRRNLALMRGQKVWFLDYSEITHQHLWSLFTNDHAFPTGVCRQIPISKRIHCSPNPQKVPTGKWHRAPVNAVRESVFSGSQNSPIPTPSMHYHIPNVNLCRNLMSKIHGKNRKGLVNLASIGFDHWHRRTLLADIRRILYPPSIYNRTVYDFDAAVNRASTTTLSNDDEER